MKKNAAEFHCLPSEAYGSLHWFRSGDFEMGNEEREIRPETFEDAESEALLDRFLTVEGHGNDPKARNMGAVRIEAKRCPMTT